MRRHAMLTRCLAILAFALFSFQLPVRSQTLEYSTIDVNGRVTIVVPRHWHVRDAAERKNIAAGADAALNPSGKPSEPMHVSSLSVVSTPEPVRAIIRVSFVQEPGTQADLNREVEANRNQVLADLKASWEG